MAKGIIAAKPGNMPHGRIILTEGGIDPTAPSNPGTIIEFTSDPGVGLGDFVDFTIDPATGYAEGISTETAGTVITGDSGPITVTAAQCVLIDAGRVNGKVTVSGGKLALVNSSNVNGKLESTSAGSVILMNTSSISGKIESSDSGILSVISCNVDGRLTSNGNSFAVVQNCVIDGKLEVLNAGTCRCSGNTVSGTTNTPGCTS